MKRVVLVFVVIAAVAIVASGQENLIYTDVVQVDSVSKAELYTRAKLWFATTYNSASDVLQIEDKDAGQLVGKAIFTYDPSFLSSCEIVRGTIKYTIKVFVKEGRYKYEITDFIHDPRGNKNGKYSVGLITTADECPNPYTMAKKWSNKTWRDIKAQIEDNTSLMITSLQQAMEKQTATENDDW